MMSHRHIYNGHPRPKADIYDCKECKEWKTADKFIRRKSNRSGIVYAMLCNSCRSALHSKIIIATDRRLKDDPSYAIAVIDNLGPEPIPIKDGWDRYNKWKMKRSAILARAGFIDKKPFNIVDYVNRKVIHGRLTTTQAEHYIESYYERHPECRPKPDGGIQRPAINDSNI